MMVVAVQGALGLNWSWRVAMENEYMSLICGRLVTWDMWESARESLVGVGISGCH